MEPLWSGYKCGIDIVVSTGNATYMTNTMSVQFLLQFCTWKRASILHSMTCLMSTIYSMVLVVTSITDKGQRSYNLQGHLECQQIISNFLMISSKTLLHVTSLLLVVWSVSLEILPIPTWLYKLIMLETSLFIITINAEWQTVSHIFRYKLFCQMFHLNLKERHRLYLH